MALSTEHRRLRALHGGLKAHADDAADLVLPIGHQVRGGRLAVLAPGPVLAEVGAADQLPHHHEVDALVHNVAAEGAGLAQLGNQLGGAQIGVEPHACAQGQQALLRPDGRVDGVPLGAADGGEQDAVGSQAGLQAGLGQGDAEGVDGAAAHGGILHK